MASRPSATLWTRMEIFQTSPNGKEWSNIFWYKQGAPVPLGNVQTDAIAIYSQVAGDLSALQHSSVTIQGASVVVNNNALSYGVEVYQAVVGLLANAITPEDVSAVVQRLSASPGPDTRGRIYISGIDTSLVNGSYLSTAGETAVDAFCFAENSPIAASVMYSPYIFGPKSAQFTALSVWNRVNLLATNRRRRPRF